MNPESVISEENLAVAAQWAERCALGLSRSERREFQQWVKDPLHKKAFARANIAGDDLDWAWAAGATDEILLGLNRKARKRKRRRVIAGSIAVAVLVVFGALWQRRPAAIELVPIATKQEQSTLNVILPKIIDLPDGSAVELMDGAQVTWDFSGKVRAVALLRGTAHFKAAPDAIRPFVVRAGNLDVQAVGTAFTVALDDKEMTVLVTEGKVRVDESSVPQAIPGTIPEPLISIDAGSSAVLPVAAAPVEPLVAKPFDKIQLQETDGWRTPRLEFSRSPLREVIAQMNRFNTRRFVLGSESVGDIRVSGVLRADKMDTLAESLEQDFGVKVERQGDSLILHRAKQP